MPEDHKRILTALNHISGEIENIPRKAKILKTTYNKAEVEALKVRRLKGIAWAKANGYYGTEIFNLAITATHPGHIRDELAKVKGV